MKNLRCVAPVLCLLLSVSASAQRRPKPAPAPQPAVATTPQGPAPTITLAVDASDAAKKIFHARMTIPARPGDLVLYYPKWIPGEHEPSGPVGETAGIFFTANGRPLAWRRDPLDMFTYHVEVPQSVTSIEATMDYMAAVELAGGYSSGSSATSEMAVVSWNQVLLYPKGWTSDQIQIKPSLKVPQNWKFGTALPLAGQQVGGSGAPPAGGVIDFAQASLTTVVDSPVIIGEHFKAVPLQQGKTPAHELDIAADSDEALTLTPQQQQGFDNLVAESGALFGARHYRDYHFLLSLSDHVAHFGLEHHESNDSRLPERYLTDPAEWAAGSSLLPHEFTHSWNGKYRRPADLATPDYQTPMQDDLLWVYEGLTEYIGNMLAARSGLSTPEEFRDTYAGYAMMFTYRSGRQWRSLEDTATAAQVLQNEPNTFTNWRRSVDYYEEGALIWLEADTIIRQKTTNARSIDDFVQLFHGKPDSGPTVRPYTFDEVVAMLNQIAPYDWRGFFTERIMNVAPHAPLGGIENGGWRVMYNETPSNAFRRDERRHHEMDHTASIGLLTNDTGTVIEVVHGGLSDKAGLAPGMKLIAVNGRRFSPERMVSALLAARNSKQPIQLIVENTEYYSTISLDYHDGPRYPHLVRDSSKPDLLSDTIKPKVTTPPKPEPQASE